MAKQEDGQYRYIEPAIVRADCQTRVIVRAPSEHGRLEPPSLALKTSLTTKPLCEALLDRITDRAHILETGTESYRFRRTMERKKKI